MLIKFFDLVANMTATHNLRVAFLPLFILYLYAELSRGTCPEGQVPLAPLPREGPVTGARKGTRLPALEGYWGRDG